MRTLVISDLHLGMANGADVLRRPAWRDVLVGALADVDRLVVLGDVLELREAPHRAAADLAGEFFAAVGREVAEIVLVPGNHDHGLIAGWLDGRLQTEDPGFLGLEQLIEPAAAGPLAARLADLAAPARTSVAYPGLWLREDVYAFHGHYSDLHTTVPMFERLAAGAMARWVAPLPDHGATPDDYEAVLAPLYAWLHTLTQRSGRALMRTGSSASSRAWAGLTGDARRAAPIRTAALTGGYLVAIKALDRLVGPLEADLSGPALRRGSLRGVRECLRRLDVRAPHVVWGHSHRSGPWPGDDPAEWRTHAGGEIVNAGCWLDQHAFHAGSPQNPYYPGAAVLVEDAGAPALTRLGDAGHEAGL